MKNTGGKSREVEKHEVRREGVREGGREGGSVDVRAVAAIRGRERES